MQKKKKDKHAEAQNKDKKEKSKSSSSDQIKELEDRISNTKYNKKTQHAIGMYKAKLAKLKEKQETRRSSKTGKSSEGYSVRKSGDGTVILLGFPSVGKSTLLNSITNANSPVGAYEFTTLDVIPGLMKYKQAKIQILDVPGIVKGAASGKGRGKEVLAVIRNADLIMIIIDVFNPQHLKVIEKEVYDTHVRLNQEKPHMKITKTSKGGIKLGTTTKLTMVDMKTLTDILNEFRINNADVVIREDISIDRFIDGIEDNKTYIPCMIVVNKIDMVSVEEQEKIKKLIKPDLMISAHKKENLQQLKDVIFNKLDFMRVYLKEVGKKADMVEPLIIFNNATLKDICLKLHRDFVDKFKFARIWGKSVKFPGQKLLKLKHKLEDQDVLEIHLK